MYLTQVPKLPSVGHTALLDRARTSSIVRGDRLVGAEPVEWVELSDYAEVEGGGVTETRIAEVRREIAAGRYITDDKLDVVVGRLLDVLHTPG